MRRQRRHAGLAPRGDCALERVFVHAPADGPVSPLRLRAPKSGVDEAEMVAERGEMGMRARKRLDREAERQGHGASADAGGRANVLGDGSPEAHGERAHFAGEPGARDDEERDLGPARDDGAVPHDRQEGARGVAQERVSHLAPARVDPVEVVDFRQQQGDVLRRRIAFPRRPSGRREERPDRGVDEAPVVNAGEGVGERRFGEKLLRVLQLLVPALQLVFEGAHGGGRPAREESPHGPSDPDAHEEGESAEPGRPGGEGHLKPRTACGR